MYNLTFLLFVTITSFISAQTIPSSFSHLASVEPKGFEGINILYDKANSEVINEIQSEDGPESVRVLKTKINAGSDEKFVVDFDPGPSADPSFIVYKDDNGNLVNVGYFSATTLIIPGNGSIYVSGHTNNMFDMKKKFVYNGGKFTEVNQPFYYVGLKTTTNKPIALFSNTKFEEKIAQLPANAEVEVLINEGDNYLVQTSFGLTGWLYIKPYEMGEPVIKGIFYAGD